MKLLLHLMWVFARIGLFTFGGGYAMLALIENAVVTEKKWLTHEEMMNVIVDGVYIDAGILYVASLNYFHHELRGIVQKGQNDATSRFKTKAKMAKNAITKINRSLDNLADRDA